MKAADLASIPNQAKIVVFAANFTPLRAVKIGFSNDKAFEPRFFGCFHIFYVFKRYTSSHKFSVKSGGIFLFYQIFNQFIPLYFSCFF